MSESTILNNVITFIDLYKSVRKEIVARFNQDFGFPNFEEEVRDRVWDRFTEEGVQSDIGHLVIKSAPRDQAIDVEMITDEVIDDVWYRVAEEMVQGGLFLAGFTLSLVVDTTSGDNFISLKAGEDMWTILKRGISEVAKESIDVSFPIVWRMKIEGGFLEKAKEQAVAKAFHEEE